MRRRLSGSASTSTHRRSSASRTRRANPARSSRSITAVIAPVVRPVWVARRPAVVAPARPRRSRHSRSVEFSPTSLATVSLMRTDCAPTFRSVSSNGFSSSVREGGDLDTEASVEKYLTYQDTCSKRRLWCKTSCNISQDVCGRTVQCHVDRARRRRRFEIDLRGERTASPRVVYETSGRVHDCGRADSHEHIARAGLERGIHIALRQRFAEPHDRGTRDISTLGTHRWTDRKGHRFVTPGMQTACTPAGELPDGPVQPYDTGRTGAQMEIVDVLRQDRAALEGMRPARDDVVGGIGPAGRNLLPPPRIPFPDEVRIARER